MKLFGTDGIRGLANEGPLTPESVLRIGQAIGLSTLKIRRDRPLVIVGIDTRLSSAMIESALIAGIASVGVDVFRTDVIPTPAVPILVKAYKADAGVMITASHNPYYDNGLKVFGPQGYKMPRSYEDLITQTLTQSITERPTHDRIGRVRRLRQAENTYVDHITRRVTSLSGLEGLRVAVDCANGAAYSIAPGVFERLGLSVHGHAVRPSVQNINEMCGATHPQGLSEIVRSGKSDIGIAFDGDADRCVMIDEHGDVVDGDHMLYIIGRHLKAVGLLGGKPIVATIVSNLGLDHSLAQHGIDVVRSPVGDRFVAEKMRELDSQLGGEKSGHTLVGQAYVGDGLATALTVLGIMNTSGQTLSDLKSGMVEFPQADRNVKVGYKIPIENLPRTLSAIRSAERAVGVPGDVTFRYSGTESLARITVQGRDRSVVDAQADAIAETFRQESPQKR